MITAKIKSIDKVRHQASNSNFLDVSFDIIDRTDQGEEVVATKRIGFNPKTDKGGIRQAITKHVSTFKIEKERAKVQRELDKEDKNVKELSEELENTEVA